jgi:hypothetical protein
VACRARCCLELSQPRVEGIELSKPAVRAEPA